MNPLASGYLGGGAVVSAAFAANSQYSEVGIYGLLGNETGVALGVPLGISDDSTFGNESSYLPFGMRHCTPLRRVAFIFGW